MPFRATFSCLNLSAFLMLCEAQLIRRLRQQATQISKSSIESSCRQSKYGGFDCEVTSSIAHHYAKQFPTVSDQGTDNLGLHVVAGVAPDADGDALEVIYRGMYGRTDSDSLGYVEKGADRYFYEDIEEILESVHFDLGSRNDICVRMFVLTVEMEVSGYGRRKSIIIPAWTIADITKTKFSSGCVYFGDGHRALGRFSFKWREAVECYDKYFGKPSNEYALCLAKRSVMQFSRRSPNGFVQFSTSLW